MIKSPADRTGLTCRAIREELAVSLHLLLGRRENANGEMGLNTLDAPCIPAVLKTLPDQHLRCGELWAPHCV